MEGGFEGGATGGREDLLERGRERFRGEVSPESFGCRRKGECRRINVERDDRLLGLGGERGVVLVVWKELMKGFAERVPEERDE